MFKTSSPNIPVSTPTPTPTFKGDRCKCRDSSKREGTHSSRTGASTPQDPHGRQPPRTVAPRKPLAGEVAGVVGVEALVDEPRARAARHQRLVVSWIGQERERERERKGGGQRAFLLLSFVLSFGSSVQSRVRAYRHGSRKEPIDERHRKARARPPPRLFSFFRLHHDRANIERKEGQSHPPGARLQSPRRRPR